jgi:hypothetical protein
MYSGRRVLHTRWVTTCTFGAVVEVEAANAKGIRHRNLGKTERLGLRLHKNGDRKEGVPEC